jgi:hypothetical protein
LSLSLFFKSTQALLKLFDLVTDESAVSFKLRFTRPTHANTTLLTRKVGITAYQTGGEILKLSELDLKFAFETLSPNGKNIEDETRAINHPHFESGFEIPLLSGTEAVIKHNELSFKLFT